jgi:hypothetical protein
MLRKVSRLDRVAKRFEDSHEHVLAAWTQMFAAECFGEIADSTTNHEVAVLALRSALNYEMQVAKNILIHLKKRGIVDEKEQRMLQCLPLEPSIECLVKELGIHLSSLDFDRYGIRVDENSRDVDRNHDELDLHRRTKVLFFDPMSQMRRFVIQQGVMRSDGGATFKVAIAEKRAERNGGYRISSTYLVGRDLTGQLFINGLPPQYEFEAIDACERWIFGMSEDDELVKEA